MFAVMGRQLYAKASPKYFGDLFKAVTTMFQVSNRMKPLYFRWYTYSSSLSVRLPIAGGITVLFTQDLCTGSSFFACHSCFYLCNKNEIELHQIIVLCNSILLITVFAEIVALGAYFVERKKSRGHYFGRSLFPVLSPLKNEGFRGVTISGGHYFGRGLLFFGKYGDYFFSQSGFECLKKSLKKRSDRYHVHLFQRLKLRDF